MRVHISDRTGRQSLRYCAVCGAALARRISPSGRAEQLARWRARRTCSRPCALRLRSFSHWARVRREMCAYPDQRPITPALTTPITRG